METMTPNIVLVGFMGAGKTSVGKAIEQLKGYRFVDLDQVIVQICGRSIPEIFSLRGEEAFRQLESAALRSLQGVRRTVLSTGGGIVGRAENWETMHRFGPVVYLEADWAVLQERIGQGEGRPLASAEGGWEKVMALWEKRLPLYLQADLRVDCSQGSPEQVALAVLGKLNEWSGTWWKK
ncbi:shikimate kinase [Desulfuromonas versatilis]|nr:shikimate kinase [Desulfuromonas versatilis]